jgi:hypothetical protein
MRQDNSVGENMAQKDGRFGGHLEDQTGEEAASNLERARSERRRSQRNKTGRTLADLPPPMTIHTSFHFLDKFEAFDPESPAPDDITPVTPTSLGIPSPPPLPQQQPSPQPGPTGPPPLKWSRPHEIAFIINVCLAQFITLGALAQTVAPLSLIGEELKVTSPGQLSWFTAAYSMTLGTFILPAGMYDLMIKDRAH